MLILRLQNSLLVWQIPGEQVYVAIMMEGNIYIAGKLCFMLLVSFCTL